MPEWWTLSGDDLLRMLYRVSDGENPDMVYMEAYANGSIRRRRDHE